MSNPTYAPPPFAHTPARRTRVNVAAKAEKVSHIFNILSIVILVVGGILGVVGAMAGLRLIVEGEFFVGLFTMAAYLVVVAIYTALMWAWVTLGTVFAGYIANRTE